MREVLGHLDGGGQKPSLAGRCESREIRKDRSLVTLQARVIRQGGPPDKGTEAGVCWGL